MARASTSGHPGPLAWVSSRQRRTTRLTVEAALSDFFAGQISDVRVNGTALTAAQIAAGYAGTAQVSQLS